MPGNLKYYQSFWVKVPSDAGGFALQQPVLGLKTPHIRADNQAQRL